MPRYAIDLHTAAPDIAAALPGPWHVGRMDGAGRGVTAEAEIYDDAGRRMTLYRTTQPALLQVRSGYPADPMHCLIVPMEETRATTTDHIIETITRRFLPRYEPVYQEHKQLVDRTAVIASHLPHASHRPGDTHASYRDGARQCHLKIPQPRFGNPAHVHLTLTVGDTLAAKIMQLIAQEDATAD
ncbi:hypothetical protein IHE61_31075 [Streptomyces sp. GKU 257-1]|nr:hypothetical protein [Streptomyces sp. GKU 257-1]